MRTAQLATADQAAPASTGEKGPRPGPFILGAQQVRQRFHDRTDTITANAQQVGPVDVLGRGFIRNVVLEVELTGGVDPATANAAFGDNGIFGVFDSLVLTDPTGTTIHRYTGYQLYLINKYLGVGSLSSTHDPKLSPFYDVSDEVNGNGKFKLRMPVEISARDALGCLMNRSASATFKVEYTLAPSSSLYASGGVPGTTLPDVRVRMYLEYWAGPDGGVAFNGQPVATEPPSLGTVQLISSVPYTGIAAGHNDIKLGRTGNMIRALIATFRNDATPSVRHTDDLPDDIALTFDGHDIDRVALDVLRSDVAERLGLTAAEDAAGGLDTGVVVWQFDDDLDGVPGNSMRSQYRATNTGTDLRIAGEWDGGGTLDVVTVEVAPNGPIFA